jgi:AcrR family transcriptional regulator
MATLVRPERRHRLSRELVLQAAMSHADEGGIEALTMRRLAEELGVAPMALYRHVANKDDLIDGLIDVVFGEIALPSTAGDWKAAMRDRAISLRDVLARHRWAIGLMEARHNPGPANLRHHDTVIASLRASGFDMARVAHSYSLLDAYIYGFALTKMNLPFDENTDMAAMADQVLAPFPINEYPNMVAFITDHAMKPGYNFGDEFEYGLEVILDGLEQQGGVA